MLGPNRNFVDRTSDLKEIEKGVKNKFKWSWLEEKDDNGDFLSGYIRKLQDSGYCYCLICDHKLNYGSRGRAALIKHAKTDFHVKLRDLTKTNQTLPAQFKTHAIQFQVICLTTPLFCHS